MDKAYNLIEAENARILSLLYLEKNLKHIMSKLNLF